MSRRGRIVIDAGTLVTPEETFSPGRLLIEEGSVAEAGGPKSIRMPEDADRIEAPDMLVAPGFVDLHVHGCGGVDVMEGSYQSLNAVSRILARHGTTSFLAATVSSPPQVLGDAVERLGAAISSKSFDGAEPLGIHLEGPFINAARRGAHKAPHVLAPDLNLLDDWIRRSKGALRLLTVAPELDGIDALLLLAGRYGVAMAMGHSNASFAEARAAADRGVCYAVHTFNAMRGFSHRDPGITGEILSDDRIFAEIIADGVHVDPAVVRIFAFAKRKLRVVLATDAMSATDMPDGSYALGNDAVEVRNGACRTSDGRLAGSTLTQEIALRNFVQWTNWPVEDAVFGLTLNPARALGLDNKGRLSPGADADVVILDRQFRVRMTLVAGRAVFNTLERNDG